MRFWVGKGQQSIHKTRHPSISAWEDTIFLDDYRAACSDPASNNVKVKILDQYSAALLVMIQLVTAGLENTGWLHSSTEITEMASGHSDLFVSLDLDDSTRDMHQVCFDNPELYPSSDSLLGHWIPSTTTCSASKTILPLA